MYRAVALWAMRRGVALSDMHRLEQLAMQAAIEFVPGNGNVLLNGEDVSQAIRTPEVSEAASEVSRIAAVRRALVAKQREIGERSSIVMEGRDIGSVVFPNATVKRYGRKGGRRSRRCRLKWWPSTFASGIGATRRGPIRRWCRLRMRCMWIQRG